jgi:AI-2 transport system substrate-binding protein
MKKMLALMLALSMALSLAACGSTSKTPASSSPAAASPAASTSAAGEAKSIKGKTVAFIPKLTGNSFFEAANAGAQKYAADWGITVKYMGSATASVTDQMTVIDQAIAEGVDAIAISSVDAKALDEKLKEAQDKGITVCTWDSDVSSTSRSLMVSQGTADVLGPMLVEMGVKSLTERGKDPTKDAIKYVWHYSQATVADQNSWYVAGEKYIKDKYPNWVAVSKPFYSEQDSQKSVSIGESILEAYPDVDLIICNDSTALPGQCQAAQNKGLTAKNITITGFCTPSGMKSYLDAGILTRWGLWDCGIQGALGCYFAAYLAAGNTVKAGDTVNVPSIGDCQIVSNDKLVSGDSTSATNNGVVLLPERVEFTKDNIANYNF